MDYYHYYDSDDSDEDAYDSPPFEVESAGFTYDSTNGLRFKNIAPENVSELKLLFRKNPAKSRVRAANKAWVTAQLRLYDIPFKASDKADILKSTLEVAVKAGKCDKLPASIVAKEMALRKQLEDLREPYNRKRQQQHDQTFASLRSPSEEARFDFDKFLAKYFLDDQGKPAPPKQPEALVLKDIGYDDFRVASKVRAVPGLKIHGTDRPDLAVIGWQGLSFESGLDDAFASLSDPNFGLHTPTCEAIFDSNRFMAKYFLSGLRGTPEKHKTLEPIKLYPFLTPSAEAAIRDAAKFIPGLGVAQMARNGTLFVGWTSNLAGFVQEAEAAAANEAEKQWLQQKAEEKAEREEEIEHMLLSHKAYAKKHRPHTGPLRMEHVVGSYTVLCTELEKESNLEIHPPKSTFGATASFHFGLVEGTMLMAQSQDALEQLREQIVEAEKDSDDEWEEKEDEYVDIAPGFYNSIGSKKRKASAEPGSSRPTVKRRLDETPRPNRVYFQWGGRDPGTGEIEIDFNNRQVGHLDFENGGLTAQGIFLHPNFFGDQKLEIKLYKKDDKPQSSEVEAWSRFSEKQHEYERTNRWH